MSKFFVINSKYARLGNDLVPDEVVSISNSRKSAISYINRKFNNNATDNFYFIVEVKKIERINANNIELSESEFKEIKLIK